MMFNIIMFTEYRVQKCGNCYYQFEWKWTKLIILCSYLLWLHFLYDNNTTGFFLLYIFFFHFLGSWNINTNTNALTKYWIHNVLCKLKKWWIHWMRSHWLITFSLRISFIFYGLNWIHFFYSSFFFIMFDRNFYYYYNKTRRDRRKTYLCLVIVEWMQRFGFVM